MKNNLAYIDFEKCKLCRKCEPECPTGAIHELNFPPRKVKPAETVESKKPVDPAPVEKKPEPVSSEETKKEEKE